MFRPDQLESLVIQKLWSLSMFQTIFLPHQHGRSALDTSRTLSVPFSIDSRCLLQIGDESPDIYVLISLGLGFRRNFLSVLHPKDTNRKFLRNPNLNEINICICSLSSPPLIYMWVSVCTFMHRHSNSGPPFSSFGPSRDYGMDLCLEIYLWTIYPYFTTFRVTTLSFY